MGAAHGHYPGEPTAVDYRLEMVDLTPPSQVTLDGHRLSPLTPASPGEGWFYQAATSTVVVQTPPLPTTRVITVVAAGSKPIDRPEATPPN